MHEWPFRCPGSARGRRIPRCFADLIRGLRLLSGWSNERLRGNLSSAALPMAVAVSAVMAPGCERRLLPDGFPDTLDCSSCHGSHKSIAPPKAVNGSTKTSEIGVGAHQAHVLDNKVSRAIACGECHPMPSDMQHHPDPKGGRADVVFGALATQADAKAAWELNQARCTNTYCHGATLRGAETRPPPVWTRVDGSQATCTSCHGNPPGGNHPAGACEACHGAVVGPGRVIVNPALHINGKVEVSSTCTSCHGAGTSDPVDGKDPRAAPPKAVNGATASTDIRVGAHQAHLNAGKIAAPVLCTECHVVPSPSDPHPDGNNQAGQVVFGALATAQAAKPAWDRNTARCSNSYCHGATLSGAASRSAPVWTQVDGSQLVCSSCHGNPPGGTHPTGPCEACHGAVVGPGGVIVNPALHINGKVEVSGRCTACHGYPPGGTHPTGACETCHGAVVGPGGVIINPSLHGNGTVEVSGRCTACHGTRTSETVDGKDARTAPPKAVNGATASTDIRVGAHQAHLNAGRIAAPVLCTECHVVPSPSDPHPDGNNQAGQVVFGWLATAQAAKPAWDRNTARCSNSYCHGATLSGAASRSAPVWTQVDGSQLVCSSCHGNPPGGTHPTGPCEACHGAVVGPGGVIVNPALHVNGTVEVSGRCTACHGYPPGGTHPTGACETCHGAVVGPGGEIINPSLHGNGTVEVSGRCTACHGTRTSETVDGRDRRTAPPKAVNGATASTDTRVGAHQAHLNAGRIAGPVLCTECHVVPSPSDPHPDGNNQAGQVVFGALATAQAAKPAWDRNTARCSNSYCHGATLSGAASRSAPVWTRVDGSQLVCTACHGNPPGGTHPTGPCEACHGAVVGPGGVIVNPALHVNGTVEAGNPHPSNYADPAIHGQDANLGRSDCRTCHGQQLEGTTVVTGCDRCHLPGWRKNCTFCHGGAAPPQGTGPLLGAPPPDLLGNADIDSIGVGVHTEHSTQGGAGSPRHPAYSCTQCHISVTDVLSPGHIFDGTPGVSEVIFTGGISLAARYSRPACTNVYCHGTGRVNADEPDFAPNVSQLGGTLTYSGCGQGAPACHLFTSLSATHGTHRSPPSGLVLPVDNCEYCHVAAASGSSAIGDANLHVNGQADVGFGSRYRYQGSGSAALSVSPAGTWNPTTRTCSQVSCHTIAPIPPPEPATWKQ
jgi:predicted CxxxxCH...CXXCH cytochrome family protein